jgi:hypothetical protein
VAESRARGGVESLADSNQPGSGERQDATDGEGWVRYVELALGYLGFLVVFVYPVSVLTTWLRLLDEFGYAPNTALYATSLISSPVLVAGTGVEIILYSFSSGLGASFARVVVLQRGLNIIYTRLLGADKVGWFDKYAPYVAALLAVLVVPFAYRYSFDLQSRFDYLLYASYMALSLGGGVLGGLVADTDEVGPSRLRQLAGAAITYLGVVLGAICLAAVSQLSLPTVEFGSQSDIQKGRLLTHSAGYWYVLDNEGLTVIPDDEAGDKIRITEPPPYGSSPKAEQQ